MWNRKDIKAKQDYLKERLLNCTNLKEKEKISLSLLTNYCLLDTTNIFKKIKYINFQQIFKRKFSISKEEQELAKLEQELFFESMPYIDDQYLMHLLNTVENLSTPNYEIKEFSFQDMNVNNEMLINFSKQFYTSLGDSEILSNACKILDDNSSLNFENGKRKGFEDTRGLTYCDYVFDKAYCNVSKSNSIIDAQVLNHEVMHGIDFYFQKKVPSENYYGFHEVPTYTIDYLMFDYMDSVGFDSEEVEKLRQEKKNYLLGLSQMTKSQINMQLMRCYGFKRKQNPSFDDIKSCITPQLLKQLLEIQSAIISYGLYQQFQNDKNYGIDNLKQFMKMVLPKEQIPNFSFIGITNEDIINYSNEISSSLNFENESSFIR